MTAHIPLEVAAIVSLLMACAYWMGRIVEREKAARRRRIALTTQLRRTQP